jgi:hypothetical protein
MPVVGIPCPPLLAGVDHPPLRPMGACRSVVVQGTQVVVVVELVV